MEAENVIREVATFASCGDSLLGIKDKTSEDEFYIKDGVIGILEDEYGPKVFISERLHVLNEKQWINAVIVKLTGHPIGCKMLCDRIQEM